MKPRRGLVLVVLAALLVAAVVADRLPRRGDGTVVRAVRGSTGPQAARSSALSSSWYCPGGTAATGGGADVTVAVANPGTRALSGTITVLVQQGPPKVTSFTVGAASVHAVGLASLVNAPWAGAVVDMTGGGAVVEQRVAGPQGEDISPCSSTASRHWYFAAGSTAKDAQLSLLLLNPFPDSAIVDLSFATTEGFRSPGDYQGLVVPGGSLQVIDIGAHVRRQDDVSTAVSVRAGRLAAGQVLIRTAPGVAGLSGVVGAPALGRTWWFPDGLVADGVTEKFEVFNPASSEAKVEVALTLDQGDAEPFELTVPAQGRVTLVANSEARVPKGVAHSAVVRSANGVPVVVQRSVEATTPRLGRADTVGGTGTARRWAFALGAATDAVDEWVIVYNPSSFPATVSFAGLAGGQRIAIDGLQGIAVPAGRRQAFRLSDHIKRDPLPLVVDATQPVVVERAVYVVGGAGVSSSVGIPLD
ncbi:MAG TPA: DUF5719 family protein [Acidimicrobiales bacterium]|nr:DUF5719 family protein [Acidimicrobiales bacterium]